EPELQRAARIGGEQDLLAADPGRGADPRREAARAEQPAVEPAAGGRGEPAGAHVDRGVARAVDRRGVPAIGGDVVAGRLAEDERIALARGDRERAGARDPGALRVDVDAERERGRAREPALLG